jgi:hypothetical protein
MANRVNWFGHSFSKRSHRMTTIGSWREPSWNLYLVLSIRLSTSTTRNDKDVELSLKLYERVTSILLGPRSQFSVVEFRIKKQWFIMHTMCIQCRHFSQECVQSNRADWLWRQRINSSLRSKSTERNVAGDSHLLSKRCCNACESILNDREPQAYALGQPAGPCFPSVVPSLNFLNVRRLVGED